MKLIKTHDEQIKVIKNGRKALPPQIESWRRREHKKRHKVLHAMLDELWADYLRHNLEVGGKNLKLGGTVTVNELMKWSHKQTLKPDE